MLTIMSFLNGAIWHTYFLLEQMHTGFQNIDKVNYNGIQFQVELKDIPKIEK